MKLSALWKLLKKEKNVTIFLKEGGRRYICAGLALYPLDGLPVLDEENLLTLMDIPPTDRENWSVRVDVAKPWMMQLMEDNTPEDTPATSTGIEIGWLDQTLIPVYTQGGLVLARAECFAPLADCKSYDLYARTVYSNTYLIAKNGYMQIAAIGCAKLMDTTAATIIMDAAKKIAADIQEAQQEDEAQTHI